MSNRHELLLKIESADSPLLSELYDQIFQLVQKTDGAAGVTLHKRRIITPPSKDDWPVYRVTVLCDAERGVWKFIGRSTVYDTASTEEAETVAAAEHCGDHLDSADCRHIFITNEVPPDELIECETCEHHFAEEDICHIAVGRDDVLNLCDSCNGRRLDDEDLRAHGVDYYEAN